MKKQVFEKLFKLMPNTILGDRYRLKNYMGEGTHGFVWQAERLADQQIVAIKFPKEQGESNQDLAEGKSLIDKPPHPNLIQVYWMGRVPPERELYAIEMEYFNGQTLSFLLDNQERRLVADFKYLFDLYRQVLQAVIHLHDHDIAHGDIKPSNILVRGENVKLSDFGSSIYTQDIYHRSRDFGGTVLYSAPEAITRLRVFEAKEAFSCDIYSLGVLLYQLMTGNLPHNTLAQVMCHSPFPLPRELSSSICVEMEKVIMRCLAKDIEFRWDNAQQLLTAFELAVQSQIQFCPICSVVSYTANQQDWSSRTLTYLSDKEWRKAELTAQEELNRSGDPHAFLLMIRAAFADGHYFRVLSYLQVYPQFLSNENDVIETIELIALETYLRCDRFLDAEEMINKCLKRQGEIFNLLLRKASLLGLQAKYHESSQLLLQLNKNNPQNPYILSRLSIVFEQMREFDKANIFKRELQSVLVQPL